MGRSRFGLTDKRWTQTVHFARVLRQVPTRGEMLLWDELRERKLDGVRFRRQHPIGPYVVDFFAPALRLAIEVDGPVHENRIEHDLRRQLRLEGCGIQFVRLSADEVEADLAGGVDRIRCVIRNANQRWLNGPGSKPRGDRVSGRPM